MGHPPGPHADPHPRNPTPEDLTDLGARKELRRTQRGIRGWRSGSQYPVYVLEAPEGGFWVYWQRSYDRILFLQEPNGKLRLLEGDETSDLPRRTSLLESLPLWKAFPEYLEGAKIWIARESSPTVSEFNRAVVDLAQLNWGADLGWALHPQIPRIFSRVVPWEYVSPNDDLEETIGAIRENRPFPGPTEDHALFVGANGNLFPFSLRSWVRPFQDIGELLGRAFAQGLPVNPQHPDRSRAYPVPFSLLEEAIEELRQAYHSLDEDSLLDLASLCSPLPPRTCLLLEYAVADRKRGIPVGRDRLFIAVLNTLAVLLLHKDQGVLLESLRREKPDLPLNPSSTHLFNVPFQRGAELVGVNPEVLAPFLRVMGRFKGRPASEGNPYTV